MFFAIFFLDFEAEKARTRRETQNQNRNSQKDTDGARRQGTFALF